MDSPSPSDARGLAAQLAALDDAELEDLLRRRGVSPAAPWRDFFDAAEGLLEQVSLDRALVRLPRTALVALAAGSVAEPQRAALTALGLVRPDGTPYRAVASRVRELAAARPDAFRPAPAPSEPAAASDVEEAAAAERAALSAAALADVLLAMLTAPLTRTGVGAVSAADRRRIVELGAVSASDELDELLAAADMAGLALPAEREWLVTAAGERWLGSSTPARWAVVAQAFADGLPDALRGPGGILPPSAWENTHPLDPDWPARGALLEAVAARWGLVCPSGAEPGWARRLRTEGRADADAVAALLPPEIDRVYLQADLSAIAPGPLAPALDLRLRTMATRESRAQASTYRFTAESLAAAVGSGETAETLRAFLSEISLTGIPQPLAYLIDSTASRHGLIRVSAGDGHTRVDSDDAQALATLEVDQSVRAIGLVRDGDGLVSRVTRDAVYWTLVDARYPAVAVDAAGDPEPLRRRRLAPDAPASTHPHDRLLATLRRARETDTDAAWLGRELDAAVRARSTIIVVAALPDGTTREFTLEATGLGGGRLRGRDRGSDTERTLPDSSIVSARPA
ncbi:helicase-associated domain-containing protein [Microbacterium sp.]|uniref:helicase-associated domain-containing protein n=1 Tax=Microbacterium sp. TaxID=51671 RepID=UPI0037CB7A30